MALRKKLDIKQLLKKNYTNSKEQQNKNLKSLRKIF
jgi:hypothetical protein